MSIIYLLKTHNIEVNDKNIIDVDDKTKERINRVKSLERKQELFGSYLLLKDILEANYNINIKDIELVYNENGKPSIKDSNIHFSLSHSNNIVILAVSDHEIGIDIELISDVKDNLVKKVLTKEELNIYSKLRSKEKNKYFFEVWTSKEASIKAIGGSLPINLNQVEIDEAITSNYHSGHDNYIIAAVGLDKFSIIERFIPKEYLKEEN